MPAEPAFLARSHGDAQNAALRPALMFWSCQRPHMMQVRCKFMTREPADRGDLRVLSGRPTSHSDEAGDVGSHSWTVGATNQRRGTWNSSSALPHSPRPPGVSVSLALGGSSSRAPFSLVIQSSTVIPEKSLCCCLALPCPRPWMWWHRSTTGHNIATATQIAKAEKSTPRRTFQPARSRSSPFLSPWTRIGAENR